MQATTQEQPRKRIALNTACWECYRNHRGCDGLRPCKRCVALGRAYSCRDPGVDERIPRKRKKPNSKESGKGCFTVMNPQHFISPKLRPVDDQRCFTSPSSFSKLDPSLEPASLDRDFDCDNFDLQPQIYRQDFPQRLLDDPHSRSPYLTRTPPQITMMFNVPPSVEALIEEVRAETEETSDHVKVSASAFQSLSVPDDMMHLTESFFKPFGLRDSTQPFAVFKYSYVDQLLLARAMQEPDDMDGFCPCLEFLLLTASPAFCAITQYSEDELLGLNCLKLLPTLPKPMPAQDRAILPYMCHQTSLRVSPVFKVYPCWYMRNRFILHTTATLQFFYASDGMISFVVCGIEKFSITESLYPPQIHAATPSVRC